LVHRLQHSRLGCWFIAFNNLVSTLEALRVLSIISVPVVYILQARLI
jgi:3-deoxy-D-manno-octulosonic acid (KDO) 8-phosphate synthase